MRQKHQQHGKHFHGDAHSQTIKPGGPLVVQHQAAHSRTDQTGQHSPQRTCQPGEGTGTPKDGKPALRTADEPGQQSGGPAEHQPGRQGRGIPHAEHRAVQRDAGLGCQNRQKPEGYADEQLLCPIRQRRKARSFLRSVIDDGQQDRQDPCGHSPQ